MWDGQGLSEFDRLALETTGFATCAEVRRHVERHFGLERDALLTRSRKWVISHPRQIAMALCYRQFSHRLSYESVGRQFGNFHYSTAIYACQKHGMAPDPVHSKLGRRARACRVDAQIKRFAA